MRLIFCFLRLFPQMPLPLYREAYFLLILLHYSCLKPVIQLSGANLKLTRYNKRELTETPDNTWKLYWHRYLYSSSIIQQNVMSMFTHLNYHISNYLNYFFIQHIFNSLLFIHVLNKLAIHLCSERLYCILWYTSIINNFI